MSDIPKSQFYKIIMFGTRAGSVPLILLMSWDTFWVPKLPERRFLVFPEIWDLYDKNNNNSNNTYNPTYVMYSK